MRRGRAAGLLLLAVVLVLVAASPAPSAATGTSAEGSTSGTRAGRVAIVSLPAVTWETVDAERPPALLDLLEQSATASMSVRTLGRITRIGEGYATIGAGNRASAEIAFAGLAMPAGEEFEEGPAREVFERRAGVAAEGDVLHLGIARLIALNARFLYDAVPGALGTALTEAGRSAAVIANADSAAGSRSSIMHRDAALAVMDRHGRVAGGVVGEELLADDPAFPFGLRMDLDVARGAFDDAWDRHDVVLVEASDLARVERYAEFITEAALEQGRQRALGAADELLAHVASAVDLDRDLLMVLAPTTPGRVPQLGVFGLAGPGVEPGEALSGSTRRPGYVSLPDVGPTVLDRLGVEVPSAMTGGLISAAGGTRFDDARLNSYVGVNELAIFRDRVMGPISHGLFIAGQAITYILAAVVLQARRRRLAPPAIFLALCLLAFPTLTFLSGLVRYDRLTGPGYVAALVAGCALMSLVALGVERVAAPRAGKFRPLIAPLLLVGAGLVLQLVDVAVGRPLQINTILGYSPMVAGRFAGFGNMSWTIASTSAIIVACGAWGARRLREGAGRSDRPDRALLVAAAALFGVVILAIGLPPLGLNFGGTLASTPAFIVTGLLLAGVTVTWRRAAGVAVFTGAVVALFALFDLSRPAESRTHIGRLLASLGDEGVGGLATVLERKLNANLSILFSSLWTLVIPLALAYLAFLAWTQPRFLRALQARVPGLRIALVGALVLGVVGGILNDSGVAIPAMMFGVLMPYLTVLVLRTAETTPP